MRSHMDQGTGIGVLEHPQRSRELVRHRECDGPRSRQLEDHSVSGAPKRAGETDAPPNLPTRNLACGAYAAGTVVLSRRGEASSLLLLHECLAAAPERGYSRSTNVGCARTTPLGDPLRTRGAGSKSASRTSGGVHAGCIRRLILGHCRLRLANAATAATSSAGSAGLPMCI